MNTCGQQTILFVLASQNSNICDNEFEKKKNFIEVINILILVHHIIMKSKIYCQLTRQKDFDEMLFYIDNIR